MKSYKQKANDEMTQKEGRAPAEQEQTETLEPEALVPPDAVAEDVPVLDAEDVEPVDVADEEYVEDERRFGKIPSSPPSREQLVTGLAFWGVILLGAILRFWGLGDKPLHHDESLHAYYSLQLMHNLQNWSSCLNPATNCYRYDPLLHGPFQFHAIAFVYQISQWLGAPDHGVNTYTVRIAAATLGTVIVGLPYFVRDRLGTLGAWLACALLAISPSMVYYSRFAREDIYMACFTLLLVVAVARYIRVRKMRWLVLASAAFSLSYATKEATFLTIAVFGSFMGALIFWEIGMRKSVRTPLSEESFFRRYLPPTAAPYVLLGYFVVAGIAGKFFFAWLKNLSTYITDPRNVNVANAYVQNLKMRTIATVPWIGMLLCVFVLVLLIREMMGKKGWPERWQMARFFKAEKQPLLYRIFSTPWMHWFFALLVGWAIFLLLFTVMFTNMPAGIGDGIWSGLYYWLQQQQVARGGQPWYYYLLLIPLYEQIGLVFALVGIVRTLLAPTRFRLFLVYWFVGNFFIYSWAAEKMPWLMIHMTMPMLLLAALGLQPAASYVLAWVRARRKSALQIETPTVQATNGQESPVPLHKRRPGLVTGGAFATVAIAFLLLLPTLQNMREVSYIHQADAPHEMMIYVQTTTDINIVMAKVDALDQAFYNGNHQMPIGVTADATWPYAWYLRDYTDVCFNFPTACPGMVNTVPVIITGGDNLPGQQAQYGADFNFHQYHMRTQWDQGYMPPPCVPTKTNLCTDPQPYTGVGPWLWLSYGDNPPPGAHFDLARAASNIWQWWWYRKAIGSVDGTYDMGLFIRKSLNVTP
ncbi:MAG TPA: flippase activity-associated protein Agl23 [Ktedonobacteraceae bacterium]